jgi:hypothetical protein
MPTPLGAAIVKEPDQLPFLGIDTNVRPAGFLKGGNLAKNVLKLFIPIRMRIWM